MNIKKKITGIDPASIEGFPINNPKAKLVYDRGNLRVVERNYYWDKDRQRGLERRTYLGYVVDNVYHDNETYASLFRRGGVRRMIPKATKKERLVSQLSSLLAAEMPLYYAIAERTGLLEDLASVWGDQRAKAVLSIAFHWLHTSANSAYLFESWSEGKLLPYESNISAKEMGKLFRSLVLEPDWRKTFFNARISRLPEDEVLSFDATKLASDAKEMSYTQYGRGNKGYIQTQVGLIVLLGHHTQMPVLFRILPGNISDVTTVQDMLFRFDEITDRKRVFAAVLDRGYCSLENLGRFADHESRVIVAAKMNFIWVQEAIEAVMPALWMNASRITQHSCWGSTVPIQKVFPDGKKRKLWIHVYRSDAMSHAQNESFYAALDQFEIQWQEQPSEILQKSPLLKFYQKINGQAPIPGIDELKRDDDAIDRAVRYFGCFANISTFACTAKEALVEYGLRDSIEKSFKAGKMAADMDIIRAHSDEVAEGRFIVSFCCMTILNELYRLMKLQTTTQTGKREIKTIQPLANEMTFNELKNYLNSIRIVYDGKGNYRWMEITKRQHSIAARLGFPQLYQKPPAWTSK